MFQQDLFTPNQDLQLFKEVDEVKQSLHKLRLSFSSHMDEFNTELMKLKNEVKKHENSL